MSHLSSSSSKKRSAHNKKRVPRKAASPNTVVSNDLGAAHRTVFQRQACIRGLSRSINPFPDSFRCQLQTTQKGYIGASTGASGHYDVLLNSPFLPWNTSAAFSGPIEISDATNKVAGYSLLCASTGPYLAYRCYGSACVISITPEAAADDLYVCLAPYVGTAQSSLTAAAKSKWARSATATFGAKETKLTSSLSVAELSGDLPMGVAVESGFGASYNAYPTFLANWRLWWNTANDASNSAGIAVSATVVYDVVFENPQYDQATLDSVSENDKLALAVHLQKAELRRKAQQDEESRLDSLAREALTDIRLYRPSLSSSSSSAKGSADKDLLSSSSSSSTPAASLARRR
jgi:hypothetical protein